ncbi:unnamed protein product [Ilex paraguariensis]|uniref:Malectin-like domain-containing protein n=1 Tax=Ilex paraguariensis TaxID=185542 RepID=A0ABC8TYG6_9AQUA
MTLAPYDRRSKNLRSFDEGIKNCYTLPKPSQGKDDKYLLRGSFMYGNYDGKNEIPKFDLYLGVNFWVTVELEKVLSYFYEEIIFVPATDLIYVCLVNTGSGIPFISALELRLLDNPIYADMVMMSTSGNLEVDVATNDDYITKAFIADGDIQHAQTRRKLIFNNSGFISIDCGESEDYTDPSSGIFYQTDAEFIGTGKNKPISSESMTLAPYDRRSKNLRSFDEGIKNCYTLPKPSQGKDDKYLLRGSFMYGNYDGKNEIPKFDLYLGVNFWVTVELEKVLSYFYEEIIFVPATDLIYVCLVNTGSGIPFISALELRLLDNPIYAELGPSLQTAHRYDVGSNQSVR